MGSCCQSAFLQRGQKDQDVVQSDDAGVPVSGAEPSAKEGRDVFAQVFPPWIRSGFGERRRGLGRLL